MDYHASITGTGSAFPSRRVTNDDIVKKIAQLGVETNDEIEAVANRLDIPMQKVLINVDRYGNTSAATIPTVLDEAVRAKKIKKGHIVLLDCFGAGLTYGAILMRW